MCALLLLKSISTLHLIMQVLVCQEVHFHKIEIKHLIFKKYKMSENYIYLGSQHSTHFFLHTISECDLFNIHISTEIYNVMIKDDRITSPYLDNVIIYELNPFIDQLNITALQHNKKDILAKFEKNNLKKFLYVLCKAEREELFIINYKYDLKQYGTFIVPVCDNVKMVLENMKILSDKEDIKVNNIINATTVYEKA